ncbi:MAG: hypothetical protein K8T91_18900 [Planctomycetes bacterium]|nr:hypothetical protein [Planctomycetota bacterium]
MADAQLTRQSHNPGVYREVVPILLMLACLGCGKSKPNYAGAIEEVLKQDRINAATFNRDRKTNGDTIAVKRYAAAMESVDLRSCPESFQQAFLRHKFAWQKQAQLLEKYDNVLGTIEAVLGLGTSDGVVAQQQEISKEIEKSWQECQKIAVHYGARLVEPQQ